MAATTVAITSYSPEIGRVGRKPQFNGLPASLFASGTVAPETIYMEAGALMQEPPAAAPVTRPAEEEPAAAG